MANIRLAEKKDISDIMPVLKSALSDWNEKIVQDCFSESYRNYIFLEDKKIIGFLCIQDTIDFVELLQICVDPHYQRQKIATQLLQFVLDDTKRPMHLEVRLSNHKAIALYEKMGFVKEGLRKKYYRDGEDAVLYANR
ncbi:MAG: ribosomal protein S18-alanine N-acetyltransferase [Coxiellaceae bacterium]|nr:ribosomal protein S18-alanine N-acetyltransferase [Coxiellaceae bacterium]